MNQEPHKPAASDEIDLSRFMKSIGDGFRRFGRGVIFSIAGIRNTFLEYRIFFAFIVTICILLGLLYALTLKRDYYKTSMVLNCSYLNGQVLSNIIEKLNLLANEDNIDVLMAELKIDSLTARNILKFEYRPFVSEDDVVEMEVLRTQLSALAPDKKDLVEKVVEKLTVENKDSYEITALVLNPSVVKALEKGFIDYLRNNDYVKRRTEINLANLQQRKSKLLADSKKLDSLKTVLMNNYQLLGKTSRGTNNVFLGDETMADPLNVFKEDLIINTELLEIERKLYLKSDFEVVDPFTTFKHTESVSVFMIVAASFFMSIVLGYLIIGVWKFDKFLDDIGQKDKQQV